MPWLGTPNTMTTQHLTARSRRHPKVYRDLATARDKIKKLERQMATQRQRDHRVRKNNSRRAVSSTKTFSCESRKSGQINELDVPGNDNAHGSVSPVEHGDLHVPPSAQYAVTPPLCGLPPNAQSGVTPPLSDLLPSAFTLPLGDLPLSAHSAVTPPLGDLPPSVQRAFTPPLVDLPPNAQCAVTPPLGDLPPSAHSAVTPPLGDLPPSAQRAFTPPLVDLSLSAQSAVTPLPGEIAPPSISPGTKAKTLIRSMGISPGLVPSVTKRLTFTESVVADLRRSSKKTFQSLLYGRHITHGRFKAMLGRELKFARNQRSENKNGSNRSKKRSQLAETRKRSVVEFLSREDNSTCLPGKRDCIKVHGRKLQKHVLRDSMEILHTKYLTENPGENVSFSTFCSWRPRQVLLVQYRNRRVCLCSKHQNIDLRLEAMQRHGTYPKTPDLLIKEMPNTDVVDEAKHTLPDGEMMSPKK